MVIDLKYHLTTIIAIFLALGTGILVGSAMIGDDGIVREQQILIVQIEEDLKNLRSQNNQFRDKVIDIEGMMVEQEEFINQLFHDAIAEQLTGLQCVVVNDAKEVWAQSMDVMEVLIIAGLDVAELGEIYSDDEEQSGGQLEGWDFCVVLAQVIPTEVGEIFQQGQIFHPTIEEISSKKGLYQLVKSFGEIKIKEEYLKKGELNDISTHTGI